MKAIGIVGSPRKNGNTEILTAHCLQAIAEEGLDTELVSLAGLDIRPCDACGMCADGAEMCPINDDVLPIFQKMTGSDAIILASPVYYGSATALMRALVERTGEMSGVRRPFAGKVGGPLVVARRSGKNFTFVELMHWFHIMGMVMPGSTYWNVAFGFEKGDVREDEEGLKIARNFGKNVAHVVKKLNA